jgi:hypothetical protein
MKFIDKTFWIVSVAIILLSFLSIKVAFISYAIYWLLKAITSTYKIKQYQNWDVIQGTVLESALVQESNFRSMINHRVPSVYYPSIKYSYLHNGNEKTATQISPFKDDFVAYNEKDARQILNKICSGKTANVYINENGNVSFLNVSKTLYFNSYITTHYFVGVSLLFLGIVI